MKKQVIGITGGIGSGKSVVMSILEEKYKACVLLTDLIAHDLMKPGAANYNGIVKEFGTEILAENGEIDRKKLGAVVFNNAKKLALLSSITHPNVIVETKNRIDAAMENPDYDMVCMESALLFDTTLPELCDQTWYVYANEEVRIERLIAGRGYTREYCLTVMGKQKKVADDMEKADVIIDNSGAVEDTAAEIEIILHSEI